MSATLQSNIFPASQDHRLGGDLGDGQGQPFHAQIGNDLFPSTFAQCAKTPVALFGTPGPGCSSPVPGMCVAYKEVPFIGEESGGDTGAVCMGIKGSDYAFSGKAAGQQ